MDLAAVLAKSPSTAYRVYDGQATIVVGDTGAEVDVLNEIGTLVWEKIDGKRTLAEIVDAVVGEYEIDRAEAERDVLEFVAALREHHMVR